MRYKTINSDSDGNIIVYGKTEKDLDGAKLVADFGTITIKASTAYLFVEILFALDMQKLLNICLTY